MYFFKIHTLKPCFHSLNLGAGEFERTLSFFLRYLNPDSKLHHAPKSFLRRKEGRGSRAADRGIRAQGEEGEGVRAQRGEVEYKGDRGRGGRAERGGRRKGHTPDT